MPLELLTPRLRLIPFTAESSAAALANREEFSRIIDALIPSDWPPETLADVEEMMASKLAAKPEDAGWWGWYIITKPGVLSDQATLIGSAGCSKWGTEGHPHFGYGILPAFYQRGFTSEAASELIKWVMGQPGITRVDATTFERHTASIKILEKCGFEFHGVSPDDLKAAENDRQGRGRLVMYVKVRR